MKKEYTLNDLAKRQVELQSQHEKIYNLLMEVADDARRARYAAETAESRAGEAVSWLEQLSVRD